MTNGDKLIAGILELEKIKRLEKEEKEKKIFINNLIIKALKKQIKELAEENKKLGGGD